MTFVSSVGGRHSSGGGSGSGSKQQRSSEERDAVVQAANYLSASRQIENLICTARESLLGSGAWNKEFYAELQARPFYQSVSTVMCGSSGKGELKFSHRTGCWPTLTVKAL